MIIRNDDSEISIPRCLLEQAANTNISANIEKTHEDMMTNDIPLGAPSSSVDRSKDISP